MNVDAVRKVAEMVQRWPFLLKTCNILQCIQLYLHVTWDYSFFHRKYFLVLLLMLLLWSAFFHYNHFVAFAHQPSLMAPKPISFLFATEYFAFTKWISMSTWMNASEWKMLKRCFVCSASLFRILIREKPMGDTESTRAARISSARKLDAFNGKVR